VRIFVDNKNEKCFLLFLIFFVKGLAVYTGNFNIPTSALTETASANPYGGSNTVAIPAGYTKLLFVPS
jgi:hypothetical protein